jgi:hypothetical protein
MKLTVKTLKGAKFVVDVDDSHTVEQVKAAIVRFVCDGCCCRLFASASGLIKKGILRMSGSTTSARGWVALIFEARSFVPLRSISS